MSTDVSTEQTNIMKTYLLPALAVIVPLVVAFGGAIITGTGTTAVVDNALKDIRGREPATRRPERSSSAWLRIRRRTGGECQPVRLRHATGISRALHGFHRRGRAADQCHSQGSARRCS